MFPIRDHYPSGRTPYVTYGLILANVAVFLVMLPMYSDPERLSRVFSVFALVPAKGDISGYLTSQFMHGGFFHLAGNMLFLWIFGDNIEDEMGHLRFLVFYLASGVIAGIAQTIPDPNSMIPMVGASGAIAGVMGSYLLMFPKARVDVLFILGIFFRIIPIPAWIVLGIWFALQVFSGATITSTGGGVAYLAHAGGFVGGLILTIPLWMNNGGFRFWRETHGHPPHPEAEYHLSRTRIPKFKRPNRY